MIRADPAEIDNVPTPSNSRESHRSGDSVPESHGSMIAFENHPINGNDDEVDLIDLNSGSCAILFPLRLTNHFKGQRSGSRTAISLALMPQARSRTHTVSTIATTPTNPGFFGIKRRSGISLAQPGIFLSRAQTTCKFVYIQ